MSDTPTHCAGCGEKLRPPWDEPGMTHCDVCRDDAPPERKTFPPEDERHDPIGCDCADCQERAEDSRAISRAANRGRASVRANLGVVCATFDPDYEDTFEDAPFAIVYEALSEGAATYTVASLLADDIPDAHEWPEGNTPFLLADLRSGTTWRIVVTAHVGEQSGPIRSLDGYEGTEDERRGHDWHERVLAIFADHGAPEPENIGESGGGASDPESFARALARFRFLSVQHGAGRYERRRWFEALDERGTLADSLRADEDGGDWQPAIIIDMDAGKEGAR